MLDLLAQLDPHSGGFDIANFIDKLARTPQSQVLMFVGACTGVRLLMHPYLAKTSAARRGGLYGFIRFFNEFLDAVVYAGVVVFMVIRPFGGQTFRIPTPSMVPTLLVNDFIGANKAIYRYTEPKRGDIVVFKPPRHAVDGRFGDVDYIKRLVGVPGDVLEVRGGSLRRDGQPVNEPYLNDPLIQYAWKLVRYEGTARPAWRGKYIPVTIIGEGGMAMANYQTGTSREYAVGGIPAEDRSIPSWKSPDMLTPEEQALSQELLAAPPAAIPPGHYIMMGDNRNSSYDSRGWGLVKREDIVGRSEFIWLPFKRWGKTR